MEFVLIPGAWHGAWFWHGVARRLREGGHRPLPLTMPGLSVGDDPRGLGIADAIGYIVKEVEGRDLHDVVLVGHSWGGMPITGVAHRIPERVANIVYVSGYVPQRGIAMNDENSPENAAYVRSAVAASPTGTVDMYFEGVQQALMQDEPEQLQRVVFDLLVPQPGGYLLDPLDVAPVTSLGIPTAYLLAERDQALPLPGAEFAGRLGLTPRPVPGTHASPLTHPAEVTRALLDSI